MKYLPEITYRNKTTKIIILTSLIIMILLSVHKRVDLYSWVPSNETKEEEHTTKHMEQDNDQPYAKVVTFPTSIITTEMQSKQHILLQKYRVNHSKPQRSKTLTSFKQFFDYVENPTRNCRNPKTFGGIVSFSKEHYLDGDKIVCLDPEFEINKNNCNIYSFGISNEWSFDDAMATYGCYVYAYDPTMKNIRYNSTNPKLAFRRGNKIFFFPIGLGKEDGLKKIGKKKYEVRRIETLMDIVGHKKNNITVDYLKIDIEGSELEFFEDILYKTPDLLYRFKQIGMEIHPRKASKHNFHVFKMYYKYFMELENRGFALFSSKMNPIAATRYVSKELGHEVGEFYEMVWGQWPD